MKKIFVLLCSVFFISSIYSQNADSGQNTSEEYSFRDFFLSTMDFLKNGPYALDFGCEPSLNKGSVTFGSLEYKWNQEYSSQIYFERENDFSTRKESIPNLGIATYNTDLLCHSFKIFPYKRYFKKKNNDHKFSLSLGMFLEFTDGTVNTTGIINNSIYGENLNLSNKYFGVYTSKEKQENTIAGPCIDLNYTLPINSWLTFRVDSTIIPVYYYKTSVYHSYSYINDSYSPEKDFTTRMLSSGIFNVKCHLDLYQIVALVAYYDFSRYTDFKSYYDINNNLNSEKHNKTTNTLRVGTAMLEATDAYVRIQTGFYRELSWVSNNEGTQFSQKWVLSVSVGF